MQNCQNRTGQWRAMLFTCSATQLRRKESFAQLRMLRFKPHSWKCRSLLLTSSDDPQTVWVRRRPALKNHRVVKLKRNFTMLHQRMSLNCQGAKSAAPPNYALVTRLPLGGSWYVRTRRSLRMSAELVLISQIQWFLRPSPSSAHVHNFFFVAFPEYDAVCRVSQGLWGFWGLDPTGTQGRCGPLDWREAPGSCRMRNCEPRPNRAELKSQV